ncbi:MAG TPA: DNA-directed RNA polymerase subunit beta' [Candidatus Dojkabacteria bacterium]|jgi:DNA-directed RNA polymerase subunit beta'
MIKDFKALKISLASPQQIMSWSHGEVRKAETINYRTHRAEVDGLMDEKIFGPTKNYECYCGKYKKIRYKGIICDKCGVEVTNKRVRRERMGHIKLASPVTHVWFSYGVPNKLSLLLGVPQKQLETVIYFARYIVTSVDENLKDEALKKLQEVYEEDNKELKAERDEKLKEIDDEYKEKEDKAKEEKKKEKRDMVLEKYSNSKKKAAAKIKSIYSQKEDKLKEKFDANMSLIKSIKEGTTLSEEDFAKVIDLGVEFFEAGMGAETIKKLLQRVDLQAEVEKLQEERKKTKSVMRQRKIIQRLRILEGMLRSEIKPEWIVLEFVPVLPPDLRPIIQLPGGRFATSDLNDLYRRLINRNNRLKRLMDLGAPEIILRNEKRMLQEAVDALIDNSHRPGNPVQNSRGQAYKSLSDMLRGKQGRFRQNLLGKRVDYSGRSVIVAGPDLSIYQCGLPKTIALELFKPFVIREIIADGFAPNIKSAKHFYESKSNEVWDILERVIQNRPVLLNRAPTLHKQGIQAFFPILVEGNAIRIHPMICKGFNADFDGDQMAVHLPLSQKAVEETMERMFANSNILRMADGSPVINVEKDMALGIYYMTSPHDEDQKIEKVFSSVEETIGRFDLGEVVLRDRIRVLVDGKIIETTPGTLLFNESLPAKIGFMNKPINKKEFGKISATVLTEFGSDAVIDMYNKIEPLAFKYATESGISVGMEDFVVSKNKDKMLLEIEKRESELTDSFYNGLLTYQEKRRLSEEAWMKLVDDVATDTWDQYQDKGNMLNLINESGALPLENPLRQISGVRGLILDPLGRIVELPLRSNYKQGLPTMEYFVAARGTRKGLADTALKTAESGYLTRKLVDVAQSAITREEECGTKEGVFLYRKEERRLEFDERMTGRYAAADIADEKTGEILVKKNEEITPEIAKKIDKTGTESVYVRSVLKCKTKEGGVCNKCYGYNLGTKRPIDLGMAVGVIAAQSMGEAATQLTLNTKHLAGRAGTDITQGLPRVEELFEIRSPKGKSEISQLDGTVTIKADPETGFTLIKVENNSKMKKEYELEEGAEPNVKTKKKVKKGDVIIKVEKGKDVVAEAEGEIEYDKKRNTIILTAEKQEEKIYEVPEDVQILVEDKDKIKAGDQLTAGSVDPKELMEYVGLEEAQQYIIDNIQLTYSIQGIAIDDKHVETVVRQMSRFAKITNSGDSEFLPGEFLDNVVADEENGILSELGKRTIKTKRMLLGITMASIRTESFLSAASFQDQVRVLSEAAALGKADPLIGLKENVIIGRPVPVGEEYLRILEKNKSKK